MPPPRISLGESSTSQSLRSALPTQAQLYPTATAADVYSDGEDEDDDASGAEGLRPGYEIPRGADSAGANDSSDPPYQRVVGLPPKEKDYERPAGGQRNDDDAYECALRK